jgi:Tfp pilus assembly protein PilF
MVWFSPGGKWLLTTGGGLFRLWEVGSWRQGPTLGESTHNVGAAFSGDGKLLALGDHAPGVIRLVVPYTGKELARLTGPEPTRLGPQCFTPDGGHLIALGEDSREIHLFDLRSIREQLKELGLDWDAPPLPDAPRVRPEPLQVEVPQGNFQETLAANRLVASAGRLARAKKHTESLAALRQAIQTDPSHARAHNDLAWQLLAGPKELRDPKSALPLARKAVELAPKQSDYLNTLGVALYSNGEPREAVAVLEKSLTAGQGQRDAVALFFLAMGHARLGDAAKAKDCYDRAVKWTEARKDLSPEHREELTAFRAEVEEVLRSAPPMK